MASYKFEAHAIATSSEINGFLSGSGSDLDIEQGPLLAVKLFDLEELHQQAIAVTVHPLIADITSMRNIVRDIRELLQGTVISARKTTSLQALLPTDGGANDTGVPTVNLSAWNITDRNALFTNLVEHSVTLPSGVTSTLLGASNNALSTQPGDILVATLAKVWEAHFGYPASIAIKDESRNTGTVGQFSRVRNLPQPTTNDLVQLLSEVKDSRAAEDLSHSLMQTLPECVEMLVESIDYIAFGDEESLQQSQLGAPGAVLTVSATVANDELTIKFTHSSQLAQSETLAKFIKASQQAISEVADSLTLMARKPTLSDFPLLALDYSQLASLEKLVANINVPFSNVETIVPCTPLQQRMINSQEKISGSYESDTAHKITPGNGATIDIVRLQMAWKKVTARHEALRTVFIPSMTRTGQSDQLILKEYNPNVDVIMCDEDNINRIIQDHHTVVHSSLKPHVGFTIFQTRSTLYCKLEISHALQDGMSTRIIYQDLTLAYQDLLPEGTIPGFREYVVWLENQDMGPSNEFWAQYLSDIPSPCHVPRKTDNASAEKGDNVLIPITCDVSSEDINKLCRTYKITSATLFQAAWIMVLRAFVGTEDILFGYLTANRELDIPGVDELVGPMINMLACRINVAAGDSCADLLKKTHDSFLETLEYQHGFVDVANKIEAAAGVLPWNSVLSIEYANEESGQSYYPSVDGSEGGSPLGFENLYGSRAPEFDVVLGVLLGDASLEVQLGYWDGVIEDEMMGKVAGMYKAVVEGWVNGGRVEGAIEEVQA
jgi:Cu/Ag efflux protein CusF